MSSGITIEFTTGSAVLVERTPLTGITSIDTTFDGWDSETTVTVSPCVDHDTIIKSVERLAKAMDTTLKVEGLEVRPW